VVREVVEIVDAAVEQPVALEEFAAARNEDVAELIRLFAETCGHLDGGVAHQLRRLRIDHHEEGVVQDGEALGELVQGPARRQVLVEQADVVGVDPQTRDGVDEQEQREDQDRRRHPVGVCEHEPDPSGEKSPDQIVESPFHELLSYSDASMRSCERGSGRRRYRRYAAARATAMPRTAS
jgi:hypothetical protein